MTKNIKKVSKKRELPNEIRLRVERGDPASMYKLRMKFLAQAKKYFGIPYARKYWTAEDTEYHSPVFLDCCGLVRRVQRDLKNDFGFRIGRWNQAYMYDTLPLDVHCEHDMKPGDLVFISGIYYNPKNKIPKHNMMHVEIWLGDGVKTIGARWNKGKVQVFDSYRFEALSYHSVTYHFKSIDTWLMGICRSHCKEHTWKTRDEEWKPHRNSIFAHTISSNESVNEGQRDQDATDCESQDSIKSCTSTPVVSRSSDVVNERWSSSSPKSSSNPYHLSSAAKSNDEEKAQVAEAQEKQQMKKKYIVADGKVTSTYELQLRPTTAKQAYKLAKNQDRMTKLKTPPATPLLTTKKPLQCGDAGTGSAKHGDKNNSALAKKKKVPTATLR